MKLTIKNDPDKKATFDPKEYFPFRAVLSDKAAELAHIGFYYKDSNLFELTIDRSTGSIIEMVLTICNRFQINKKKLMLPDMANSDMIS
ncbi:MAG: hypothetical protein ILO36_06665, partial [Abditibacteriota bacterium]|nr:hypothetical protein [Abditibacteriota bacterium]